MSQLPEALIVHCVTGRIRLKIPSQKRNDVFFENLLKKMSGFPGVINIQVNPLTAGVLIEHEGDITALDNFLGEHRLVRLVELPARGADTKRQEQNLMEKLDMQARSISSEHNQMSNLAVLSLIGLSLYQISRGNLQAPAWHAALWYAYNIYQQSRNSSQPQSYCQDEDNRVAAGSKADQD